MRYQLQRHFVITFGTKQGVFAEVLEETLLKRLGWQNPVAFWVSWYIRRDDFGNLFSHLFVTYISVQSVITDSVKSLWQNVLNHTSDESEGREGFVFNLLGFVVTVPVADRFAVIPFNSANRDRRRDDIFCQVFCQPLSPWRYFTGLKESDKALGIIFPCTVDVFFDSRVIDIVPQHVEQMILPFTVHHVVRNIRDIFPLFHRINSTGGHEYMKMGVVMSGPSGGLENDNVSDVEFNTGTGLENIFETGITCSHERTEQCGIVVKPCSQELRHSQHHMSISYSWQKPSADEVGPSVGISLCTGKTETGFAGESDTSYFSAVATSVLDKAHLFGIAAVKHFLHGIIVIGNVKAWTELLKRIPVVIENLLKRIFVNAFHGRSLRTTITELAG